MPDRLGPLYDGDGMLLEGEGPTTFSAAQDETMAFRVIVQASTSDSGGELQLGDRLWVVPWDLDLDGISGRVVALAQLVRAGGRVGIASESTDRGELVHEALMLVLREGEASH